MKKLMTTMALLVSGVMAFGEMNAKFDASTASSDSWSTGWSGATAKAELDTTDKVLKISSGSDAVSRLVNTDGSTLLLGDTTANVYFDVSLDVVGQAMDDIPVIADESGAPAKLALFLLDGADVDGIASEAAGTNLWAIAGNPNGGKILALLNADVDSLLKGTSRLTIQTYETVLASTSSDWCGFAIYQDGGKTSGTISPVKIKRTWSYDTEGTAVNWSSADLIGAGYLSSGDTKIATKLADKRQSILLSLRSGVEGQSFSRLDFIGNVNVSTVESTLTKYDFIADDEEPTTASVTLTNVRISVDPADAYDETAKTLSKDCTITVTLNEGLDVLKFGASTENTLVKQSDGTFKYTFSAGNDIWFSAAAASVTLNGTAYETLAEALAVGGETGGMLSLKTNLSDTDFGNDGFLSLTGEWTLDLAGKNIVGKGEETDNFGVVYLASGTLVITNSTEELGSIQSTTTDRPAVCCEKEEAKLSIYGGIIKGSIRDIVLEGDGEDDGEAPAEGEETETVEPNVTIYGGSFTVEPNALWLAEGKEAKLDATSTYWVVGDKSTDETTWATVLGDADASGAYSIDDAADLLAFARYVNGTDVDALATEGVTFKLTASIDMTDQTWPGIGVKDSTPFNGTFDGGSQTISNLTLPRQNYAALFNCIGSAAVIKDVTVNVVRFADGTAEEYGGAAIVGYVAGSTDGTTTISDCTATGTISGTHNVAGICARAKNNITLTNCKNEANITTSYSKIGGMIAIAEGGTVVIEGCTNTGTVTASGTYVSDDKTCNAGKDGVSGILAFEQSSPTVTIKNCVSTGELKATNASSEAADTAKIGTIKAAGTSATYAEISGNTARADLVASVDQAIDGLTFATVADDTATFVANSAVSTVGSGVTYKVMASGATYEFAKEGETITFDITLATVEVTMDSDLSTDEYEITEVKNAENEKVITYTLAKKETVEPLDPTSDTGATYKSDTEAAAAAEAFNAAVKENPELITVPSEVTDDTDKSTYRGLFEAVADGTTVKLAFTPDAKETLETAAETAVESIELQTFAVSDSTSGQSLLTISKPVAGLWYTLLTGTDTPASLPTAYSQQATSSNTALTFNVTKDTNADRAFFRVKITTTKVNSTGLNE